MDRDVLAIHITPVVRSHTLTQPVFHHWTKFLFILGQRILPDSAISQQRAYTQLLLRVELQPSSMKSIPRSASTTSLRCDANRNDFPRETNNVGQDMPCGRVLRRLPDTIPRSQTEMTQRLLQVLTDALSLIEDDDTMDWE